MTPSLACSDIPSMHAPASRGTGRTAWQSRRISNTTRHDRHLTRVALISSERLHVFLRFGRPIDVQRVNGRTRVAFFTPGQIFCRVWWQGNEYGTLAWSATVMQAGLPGEGIQRLIGVSPGAHLLVHAVGKLRVQQLLELVNAIEANNVDLVCLPSRYWSIVQNRLAALVEPPRFEPDDRRWIEETERLA